MHTHIVKASSPMNIHIHIHIDSHARTLVHTHKWVFYETRVCVSACVPWGRRQPLAWCFGTWCVDACLCICVHVCIQVAAEERKAAQERSAVSPIMHTHKHAQTHTYVHTRWDALCSLPRSRLFVCRHMRMCVCVSISVCIGQGKSKDVYVCVYVCRTKHEQGYLRHTNVHRVVYDGRCMHVCACVCVHD